jgi:hypothetical protein
MAPADRSDAQEFGYHSSDPAQLDMFGPPPPLTYDPDHECVRAELLEILAKARAAPQVPWETKQVSYWQTAFPQMANRLPSDEAAQLRLQFAAELERLQAA